MTWAGYVGFPDDLLILCVVSRGGWLLCAVLKTGCSPGKNCSSVCVQPSAERCRTPSARLCLGLARATDSSLLETPQGPQNQLASAAVA